jgi:hypothetical protein
MRSTLDKKTSSNIEGPKPPYVRPQLSRLSLAEDRTKLQAEVYTASSSSQSASASSWLSRVRLRRRSDYAVHATALSVPTFSIRSLGDISWVSAARLNISRKLRGASTGSRLPSACVALSVQFELRNSLCNLGLKTSEHR